MLFVPPSIPFMIPDASAQTPTILILDPLPSVVQVGDTVVFSGQLLTAMENLLLRVQQFTSRMMLVLEQIQSMER